MSNPNLQPSHPFDVVERLLAARHSCRAFLDRPVPQADIERLLRAAQRTASWCNTQPWQVVVTSPRATEAYRQALAAHIAANDPRPDIPHPTYEGRYLDRRRVCGFALYESVGVARGDRVASAAQAAENFKFFGAPHIAIVSTPKSLGPYGAIDCGGYIATFLLVAQSLGLAAVPQATLAVHADFAHAYFDIPEDRDLVAGVSFGYEDAAHPANAFRTERAGLDEAVDFRF